MSKLVILFVTVFADMVGMAMVLPLLPFYARSFRVECGDDRRARFPLVGATHDYVTLVAALTLMPIGAAFLFPCLSGQLSRIIGRRERGVYMGIQHMFGGASRVAFPIGAGIAMDQWGLGVPFFVAAALVLAVLPLTRLRPSPQKSSTSPTPAM